MKFSPLALVSMPPLWAWSSGFFLTPLATALGSSNPALAASAWQAVVFVTSATVAVQILSKAAGQIEPTPAREITSRELGAALRAGREQERALAEAQREYAKTVQITSSGSMKLVLGHNARAFHFPAGVGTEQLLALAECIGSGNHPTDRALVPPFERGTGKSYQLMRDWMLYGSAHHKAGELAVSRSGRGDWTLTDKGVETLFMWISHLSPDEGGSRAKKARLLLSNTVKKRLSNQNNA